MTAFAIICAVMLAAALLWITLPLLRPQPPIDPATTRGERRTASLVMALSVSALAIAMYLGLTNWDWQAAETQAENNANVEDILRQLEAKLASNPQDVEGWLLLGRSYTAMGRYARAADAFQQAYDLTKGDNVEAVIGLGEALALVDEASLAGRAGQLFDTALKMAPTHPKALWYGSMAALQAGDLRTGRDRLQLLMAQNPPQELRGVLERQIQDLTQQLGEAGQQAGQRAEQGAQAAGTPDSSGSAASPATQQRVIRASITIAPEIQQQLREPIALFVLARDPAAGGPPLAVQRRSSAELPLTIELSERDAMMPTRTIASVPRVQVVARLSRSGAPQAGSGDFYGEADYDFSKDAGTLQITIDRTVP
jgi:cytochrome c-type biogenesis protein CcmH